MTTDPAPPRRRRDDGRLALPFYEPRHVELAGRIDDWCAANAALWTDARDPGATGRVLAKELGRAGWFPFGEPADLRSVCLVRESLAYADDLADYAYSIQSLAATPLLRFGDAGQRDRFRADLAAGELIASFAVTEPEGGSDVAALRTTAVRDGDRYVLNGRKAWIANATIAGLHTVIARTGEGPGALGLTAFLVPATTPGLTVEPVDLIAPRSIGHLALTDCAVPAANVLGRPGRGFVVAMDVLDRYRMTVGAAAVGFAGRALDAALGWTRARKLFDLQLVRATLADLHVKLTASALLVARAAWEADRGNRRFAVHSSVAKLHATEAAQEIVDGCVQMCGAAGLVHGSLLERLYRQVRSLRLYEGASEVQKMIIAGALPAGTHPGSVTA